MELAVAPLASSIFLMGIFIATGYVKADCYRLLHRLVVVRGIFRLQYSRRDIIRPLLSYLSESPQVRAIDREVVEITPNFLPKWFYYWYTEAQASDYLRVTN